MSTRCNVHVIQEGLSWEETVQLYHHCDGYPSHMLPLFGEAFKKFGGDWRCGRVGHVAAFLCAIDPTGFEAESGLQLHGDIEYFYKLTVLNERGGSLAETPTWLIETLRPSGQSVHPPMPILEAATQADAIEEKASELLEGK